MNQLLNLIQTDEQRMKIVAELLLDDGLMELIREAIKNGHHNAYMDELDVPQAGSKAELLYRVLDSYRHPENYFEDIWAQEDDSEETA